MVGRSAILRLMWLNFLSVSVSVSVDERRRKLRALLAGTRSVPMATIMDPVSARLAESLAFEAGLMGGSVAALAVLGAPDVMLLTLSELAEQVRRCARVSNVPIVVDGDHGYGNALNVMRTAQEIAAAGAAGLMIEDTELPARHGAWGDLRLLPVEESIDKIKAAVAARGDSDMLLFARTSMTATSGLDEIIERLKAYEALGVDALFVPGLRERDQLERVARAVSLPLGIGGASDGLIRARVPREAGRARVFQRTPDLRCRGAGNARRHEGIARRRAGLFTPRHSAEIPDGHRHRRPRN